MAENSDTRDRVRELVKQVLASVPPDKSERPNPIERVVVNSLQEKVGKEFDRDESAKSLITEDDLRGLDPGSKVRVSESAKFTPLADDELKAAISTYIINKENDLVGQMSSQGTTPRRLTDLIGSLCDLTSGSG
ncbi:MAG TPA: coenzyme F420-0:L-glutamate ligase, partial [Pyrinomonadaceae bacterium]|nr:coenzyme F420-0:L-glutamate ligase [Pyrinomonadaceae bacterium]